jgi:UDP-3-O-[3-hydroxymyristoyl] glucosamine N-acyltransferase
LKLSKIIEILELKITLKDDFDISGINDITLASKDEVSFLSDSKYQDNLKETKARAVLVKSIDEKLVPKESIALVVKNPYLSMAILSGYFTNIDSKKVTIMDGSFIADDVKIGEGSIIYPNVTILRGTTIGKNCIIQAGSVIGSDGFGYALNENGEHIKISHRGIVVLEDRVEIGANCTIDRAVFGETRIKEGTKIDNLVHIGHNCEVGKNSIITGQCGLAGSSKLGDSVILGAQSGVAGHIEVGDRAVVAARGGVTKSIQGGQTYAGFPIKKHKEWLKTEAIISKITKER